MTPATHTGQTGHADRDGRPGRPGRLGRSGSAWFLVLALAVMSAFFVSLALGSVAVPLKDVFGYLGGATDVPRTSAAILGLFRLPKALTAVLAGAALAASGLAMQTLFRNPLAGPFILGINSGASLGVAVVLLAAGVTTKGTLISGLSHLGDMGIAAAASIGSGLVLMLVLAAAGRVENVMTLLILGLLFGYAVDALTTILIHFSEAERLEIYISWTFGSFAGVTWQQLAVLLVAVPLGLLVLWILVKPLNALLLGDNYARSLGINLRPIRAAIIAATALLSGAITAFCGPIGFIGVAIPHLARSLFATSDHRTLMPATILLGAFAALVADLVAQLPGSQAILPLNAVTSLLGAPVVAWVILRRRNLRETFGS